MQNGIHYTTVGDDELDTGSHQDEGDAGCHAAHAFQQGMPNDLALGTRDKASTQPADEEEQPYDGQRIISQEGDDRGAEKDQNDEDNENTKEDAGSAQIGIAFKSDGGITLTVRLVFFEDQRGFRIAVNFTGIADQKPG
ncbi:hypothetical protein SDC9_118096 [bioreactor metagenome]|uniref:Uncharacterized protein n=1 Tax=bioreactor metagenome TaxID=1076179 RepID=A0A645C735_9ZZZZ